MADTQLILETLVKGTEASRKSLNSVTKSVDDMDAAVKKSSKMGSILKDNAEGFKAIGTAAAGALTGVVALGTASVLQASKMQDLRQSFDTLLGSAEKGKALFLEIQKMATATPFTSADLAAATSTMLGFGVAEEKVLPMMKQLWDISMGNADRFQHLALAFAQVSAAGKLTGQDLLQMVNAGFNPLQEISKKTGKSISELKDDMADGAISVKMVEDAMKGATSEGGRFFGGMEKASKTFSWVMSTLKDNIGITLAAIGGFANGEVVKGGLLDSLTQGMQKLMPYLDKFTQWASDPANANLMKNILLAVWAVSALIVSLWGLVFVGGKVYAIWQALSATWVFLSGIFTTAILPALSAIGAALGAVTAPVWIVIGAITALIAAGVALYTHWDQVVVFAQNLWAKITSIFEYGTALVAGIFITVFDKMGIDIVDIFQKLYLGLEIAWLGIKLLAQAGLNWVTGAFKTALAPITAAWNVLWGALGSSVIAAWSVVKQTISESLNWIIDSINRIINAMNGIASKGAKSLGMSITTVPTIPRLADGGIVKARPGGIIANIGEGGEDEAVIPLSKMPQMGGMGREINFYFTGTFWNGVVDEIGDGIVTKLTRMSYI